MRCTEVPTRRVALALTLVAMLAAPSALAEPPPAADPPPTDTPDPPAPAPPQNPPAHTLEPPPPNWARPREAPSDPKLSSGLWLLGLGGLFLGGGVGVYLDSDAPSRRCDGSTPDTCYSRKPDAAVGAGIALMVGGAGSMLMGASTLFAHAREKHNYPHRSTGMASAGMVLTGVGAAGVVGSAALWLWGWSEQDDALGPAAFMFLTSAGILATGFPLWLKGASAPAEGESKGSPRTKEDDILRSPAMLYAGVGMGVAGLGIMAGSFVLNGQDDNDADGGLGMVFPAMVAGGLLIGLGAPLAVIGGSRVRPRDAYALVPEVDVGLTGGNLRWRY